MRVNNGGGKVAKSGVFHKILGRYEKVLTWAVGNPKKTLVMAFGMPHTHIRHIR